MKSLCILLAVIGGMLMFTGFLSSSNIEDADEGVSMFCAGSWILGIAVAGWIFL